MTTLYSSGEEPQIGDRVMEPGDVGYEILGLGTPIVRQVSLDMVYFNKNTVENGNCDGGWLIRRFKLISRGNTAFRNRVMRND